MNSGELKVDVPLASVESDCEDLGETASQTHTPSKKLPRPQQHQQQPPNRPKPGSAGVRKPGVSPRFNLDAGGGGDSVTGSLEDLVSSFDEKLTQCFHDYQEQVDKIAPVQVSKSELLCQNLLTNCSCSGPISRGDHERVPSLVDDHGQLRQHDAD